MEKKILFILLFVTIIGAIPFLNLGGNSNNHPLNVLASVNDEGNRVITFNLFDRSKTHISFESIQVIQTEYIEDCKNETGYSDDDASVTSVLPYEVNGEKRYEVCRINGQMEVIPKQSFFCIKDKCEIILEGEYDSPLGRWLKINLTDNSTKISREISIETWADRVLSGNSIVITETGPIIKDCLAADYILYYVCLLAFFSIAATIVSLIFAKLKKTDGFLERTALIILAWAATSPILSLIDSRFHPLTNQLLLYLPVIVLQAALINLFANKSVSKKEALLLSISANTLMWVFGILLVIVLTLFDNHPFKQELVSQSIAFMIVFSVEIQNFALQNGLDFLV